jgi:hypothetical protein
MKNLRSWMTLLAGTVLMVAFSSVASAQATRTWVSGVGDDANPCSRTAPCKTFAGAISKTASPGEIDCLDPGGFGAVTITKSITIDCDPGPGSILASGTQGIVINALTTDTIVIRNLNISGAGTTLGTNGINIITAKSVLLHEVDIERFSNSCINIGTAVANTVQVQVEDTRMMNCGASGIAAGQGAKVNVTHSYIATVTNGVSQSGSGSQLFMTGSTVVGAGNALQSSGGNFIGASGNTFANNGVIFNQNGGSIFTGNDNPGFGNGPAGATAGAVTKN